MKTPLLLIARRIRCSTCGVRTVHLTNPSLIQSNTTSTASRPSKYRAACNDQAAFSSFLAFHKSNCDCRPSQNSAEPPNTRSSRNAIGAFMADLPSSRS